MYEHIQRRKRMSEIREMNEKDRLTTLIWAAMEESDNWAKKLYPGLPKSFIKGCYVKLVSALNDIDSAVHYQTLAENQKLLNEPTPKSNMDKVADAIQAEVDTK